MKQELEDQVFQDVCESGIQEPHAINTVFVVPNRASKKMTYRKLKNYPNAEIIDASCFQNSSSSILAQSSLPEPKNNVRTATQELINLKKNDISYDSPGKDDRLEINNVDIDRSCEVIFDENIAVSHEINENPSENATFLKEDEDCDVNLRIDVPSNLKSLSGSVFGVGLCERNASTQEEQVNNALKDHIERNISIRRAAHIHGVKQNLLAAKINKNTQVSSSKGALGADPALTEQEELQLVEWIRSRYKKGCPVKKIDLINRVAEIVSDGRTTRFKGGVPGEKWFNNFITRNPAVSTLGPAARLDSREIPSKRSILSWFKRCSNHLKVFGKDHLLKDPHSIGNVEEFTVCLVATKTSVSNENYKNNELYLPKESSGNITILIGACADGTLMPPMPVYSCRKPPPILINSIPSGWGIGLSKDGNINKEVVHSYFKNILIPWLAEHGRLPFILFVDKLKSFLSIDITDYCAQKGLLCYNFYPNSSCVIQPLHKVIQNIKKSWNVLSQHKNDKEALLKVCQKLNDLLNEIAPPHSLIKNFMRCGMYPFSHKAPDYRNCPLNIEGVGASKNFKSCDYAVALDVFEDMIGTTKTEIFKETLKGFKLLKSEDKGLYKIWHKMISKVDVTRNQSMEIQDYRHEKIIRGAFRKLPRPETYLMVLDDNCIQDDDTEGGYLGNFVSGDINIDNFDEEDETLPNIVGNLKPVGELEVMFFNGIDVDNEDNSSESEDDKSPECLTSDNWKIRYLSEERDVTKDSVRLKEIRKRERMLRKQRQYESEVGENVHKKFKKVLDSRACSSCFQQEGELIKCIMCKKYTHFECMMEEEQQILSDLYEDNVAFDYICPICS